MTQYPAALTIAGSDSGGGAGIQADLKTFSALGVYGTSAITAITAQNTVGVFGVEAIAPALVAAQIKVVLEDIDIGAVKIGMLASVEVIEAVADALEGYTGPIVLDPVMIAKSGDALLANDAVSALRENLLPRATVLTPNIPEAACLLAQSEELSPNGLQRQGRELLALGPKAVLMKGGHGAGDICTDWLINGAEIALKADRIETRNTHGTGCTLSSAIAAGLARGQPVDTAVRAAHGWLHQAILRADDLNIGAGHGPVHHFHKVWS